MRPSPFSLALVLLGCLANALTGQVEPEQGRAAFLLVPVGARSTALGQASVADWGSSEAVFWNPAGLASLTNTELALHHASTFVSNNTVLSAIVPAGRLGRIGLTAYLVDFGSQDVIPPGGPVTGRFSPKNIELITSFATTLVSGLTAGVNYKLIQFRQDCSGDCRLFPSVAGTTHGFDLGLQYQVGGIEGPLRFGAALQHAGFALQVENGEQADPLPTRLQIGAAVRIKFRAPSEGVEPIDARLLVDVQNRWRDFSDADLRVGLELGYGTLIRLRTGYAGINRVFQDDDGGAGARGPSVGIGARLGNVSFDFSRIFFDNANFDEPVYFGIRLDI